MRPHAAFALSSLAPPVELKDYLHFHGMLCSPRTASRCIKTFSGSVLFVPANRTNGDLAAYDASDGILSLFSYYMLILAGFFGLCTLLKLTRFLEAHENAIIKPRIDHHGGEIVALNDAALRVDRNVFDHVKEQTESNHLYLKRRFEYNFRLLSVSVMMLHLECDKNLLHLVEVYRFNNRFLRVVFEKVFDTMGFVLRRIRDMKRFVRSLILGKNK